LKNLIAKNIVFTIKPINIKEFQFDYILSRCTMFLYISYNIILLYLHRA